MRAVIQRVSEASVSTDGSTKASIGKGLLVLLGIEDADEREDADWLSRKISTLRIFDDTEGVMNLSVNEVKGEVLVISQFTLHAKTKKGTRPSYVRAAHPDKAAPLYEYFLDRMQYDAEKAVRSGTFGADMKVGLVNDGPVTILIDTKDKNF